tara:strand:+ start:511 stop:927 length:417 start_codon:yes stop_codon:yes gene_type:complete
MRKPKLIKNSKTKKITYTSIKPKRRAKNSLINADILKALILEDFNLECILEHKFHDTRKWKIDLFIPDIKIAIELEGGVYTGGRHTRPKGFLADIEKYNNITILGLRLLRYAHVEHTYKDILKDLKELIKNGKSRREY